MKSIRQAAIFLLMVSLSLSGTCAIAGQSSEGPDEKPPKPYSIGFLPFARFSDDAGFGFGLVLQWDDKRSPEYQPYYYTHRASFELTTRGIQEYVYRFDSKYLLPADLRLTFDACYQVSLLEPYHGPGGAQTNYNSAFIDSTSLDYRGRFYYMYDKRYFQVNTLVQGQLRSDAIRWLVGLVLLKTQVDTIDYSDFDRPAGETLLAHHWDYLGADTAGGWENGLLAGLVWDRRDHETSPQRGFWSEVLLRWVPGILGNDFSYAVLTATHRQYVPLSEKITFAFRVSGRYMTEGAPFFSVPRLDGSFRTETGLGGSKTIRGVLWQRAVGKRFFYSNLELRYRFLPLWRTGYMAASGFYDFGCLFDEEPTAELYDMSEEVTDRLHQGVGFGLRLAPNDTFIMGLELGFPVDGELDGPGVKVYMDLDWLF